MKCPVCKSELKQEYELRCHYGVEESLYRCINCRQYSEQYVYGSTEINVGDFTTGYHYTVEYSEIKEIRKKIEQVAKLYSKEEGLS